MTMFQMKLPDVGEGVAEAEIVEWLVAVGDAVTPDSVLAEVLTDKATVEVVCPVTGVVTGVARRAGRRARRRQRIGRHRIGRSGTCAQGRLERRGERRRVRCSGSEISTAHIGCPGRATDRCASGTGTGVVARNRRD